jgi:hypothetical protein
MGGIFQADIFIREALLIGINDLRKLPWLVDFMLEDLKLNRYVKEKYGQKSIDACKEFLLNNEIDVYMRPRDDRDRLPCITIELAEGTEKVEMKHMADLSVNEVALLPNQIGKPIPFIVPIFVPSGYDQSLGVLEVPSTVNLNLVEPGQILVNPTNGCGYVIRGLIANGIQIEPGLEINASQLAVVPHYQYYKARIEHTFFEEKYIISANAHGDPNNVIFLWNIALYSILRYRESLLEANGMAESSVNFTGPDQNTAWTTPGGEKAYSRVFTINCQTEHTWVKAPARIIESVTFAPKKTCKGLEGGIKIISNLGTPSYFSTSDDLQTIKDNDDE